jgi:hypothetical protein
MVKAKVALCNADGPSIQNLLFYSLLSVSINIEDTKT